MTWHLYAIDSFFVDVDNDALSNIVLNSHFTYMILMLSC